ncbi:hypothetical protein Pmani_004408, partial [Petrolisthes manimaculis]
HVGWGIAWYINGLLIPEINVVRGKTYTFVVEGGYDPERPARYHPFYITDDPEGGYEFKSPAQRDRDVSILGRGGGGGVLGREGEKWGEGGKGGKGEKECRKNGVYEFKTPAQRDRTRVFAGIGEDRDGTKVPNAFGRLCEWSPNPNQPPSDSFDSFGGYQRTLTLNCQEGQPGILQWTPDANTPDLVYYQCYTHRYLGWKINVHNTCDEGVITTAGSNPQPTIVLPEPGTK